MNLEKILQLTGTLLSKEVEEKIRQDIATEESKSNGRVIDEFCLWLNERREAVETHLRHTLLRFQAEVLGQVLRKLLGSSRSKITNRSIKEGTLLEQINTEDQLSAREKRASNESIEDKEIHEPKALQRKKSKAKRHKPNQINGCLKSSLQLAVRIGKAEVAEVTAEFTKISNEIRNWRNEQGKARRFVRDCVEVDRGCALRQSQLLEKIGSFVLTASSSQRKVYLHETWDAHQVYCASMPCLMQESESETETEAETTKVHPMYQCDKDCCIKSVCYTESFALVVLLLVDVKKTLSQHAFDNKPYIRGNYELHNVNSAGKAVCKSTLPVNLSAFQSVKLFECGSDRLLVIGYENQTAVEIELRRTPSSFSSTRFECFVVCQQAFGLDCHVDAKERVSSRRLVSFDYNVTSDCALALHYNCAFIYRVGRKPLLQQQAVIHNCNHETSFVKCAISSCFCVVVCLLNDEGKYSMVTGYVSLFDFNGVAIKIVQPACPISSVSVHPMSDILLVESSDGLQTRLLYVSINGKALMYVSVRGSTRCKRHATLKFPQHSCSLDEKQLLAAESKRSVEERCQCLVDFPVVTASGSAIFADCKSAFFVATSCGTLTRYRKVFKEMDQVDFALAEQQRIITITNPTRDGEQLITGLCVLDEQSLLLVVNNTHLHHVKLNSKGVRTVHLVRFSKACFRSMARAFAIATNGTSLFVAIEGFSTVQKLERTRDACDWCLCSTYNLPAGWRTHFLHFDTYSRSFTLTARCHDAAGSHYRVFFMDERFRKFNQRSISLPVDCSLDLCLRRGSTCFIRCDLIKTGESVLLLDLGNSSIAYCQCMDSEYVAYLFGDGPVVSEVVPTATCAHHLMHDALPLPLPLPLTIIQYRHGKIFRIRYDSSAPKQPTSDQIPRSASDPRARSQTDRSHANRQCILH